MPEQDQKPYLPSQSQQQYLPTQAPPPPQGNSCQMVSTLPNHDTNVGVQCSIGGGNVTVGGVNPRRI